MGDGSSNQYWSHQANLMAEEHCFDLAARPTRRGCMAVRRGLGGAWLAKITSALSQHWKQKNLRKELRGKMNHSARDSNAITSNLG
jgi:hypothetical protein